MRLRRQVAPTTASRTDFIYVYRGYKIELQPTGLKYASTLGNFSAYIKLTRRENMSLPDLMKTSAYGNHIGGTCEEAERYLDKVIDFLLADADNRVDCLAKLDKFAATDNRFQ